MGRHHHRHQGRAVSATPPAGGTVANKDGAGGAASLLPGLAAAMFAPLVASTAGVAADASNIVTAVPGAVADDDEGHDAFAGDSEDDDDFEPSGDDDDDDDDDDGDHDEEDEEEYDDREYDEDHDVTPNVRAPHPFHRPAAASRPARPPPAVAAAAPSATAVGRQILDSVCDLYGPDGLAVGEGLSDLARRYGVDDPGAHGGGIVAPKRRIWVMLIGNHSAGKSSFVNWYVERPVQKTSVAIETSGFTFVVQGKARETFNGPATVKLFPFLKGISEMKGLLPALSTEIVDTPGLVDGEMQYPFDPEEALIRMATHVDLIFSFFDPIGQALCARTMRIVERLCDAHGHKMHFFLSKADTVPDETDRQRVLVQIAQNLTHRIKDRQFSLNIPPIYIPTDEPVAVRNHMHEVTRVVDKTIAMGVQQTLEQLERDSRRVADRIDRRLREDAGARAHNSRDAGRGCLLLGLAAVPPAVALAGLAARAGWVVGGDGGHPDEVVWAANAADQLVS
ncbi:hypothetical protein HK405_007799, partial [Cladochytrium tenue]